jgi:hypothetical protein
MDGRGPDEGVREAVRVRPGSGRAPLSLQREALEAPEGGVGRVGRLPVAGFETFIAVEERVNGLRRLEPGEMGAETEVSATSE